MIVPYNNSIPIRHLLTAAGVWILLELGNIALKFGGIYFGMPVFPIHVFTGPEFHFRGIPYIVVFLAMLYLVLKNCRRLKPGHLWLIGLVLIIFSNLGQGNVDLAFLRPFYYRGLHYYSDALAIKDASEWLKNFNNIQQDLQLHARTHPPFAVLLHYYIIKSTGGSIYFLSGIFVLISSLSGVFVYRTFRLLGVDYERAKLLFILFTVIPAVNIYSGVSLDGIVLTGASIFLMGMVTIQGNSNRMWGYFWMFIGLTMVNLLTFGGVFLIAVLGVMTFYDTLKGKLESVLVGLVPLMGFVIVLVLLFSVFNYNHIAAFSKASHLENPYGFILLASPVKYLYFRIACIAEILLFLSLGFAALLFTIKRHGIEILDLNNVENRIFFFAAAILLSMFLTGAYRVGETARAAIYIYPFIIVILRRLRVEVVNDLIVLAGIQTSAMQICGYYFW